MQRRILNDSLCVLPVSVSHVECITMDLLTKRAKNNFNNF